MPELAYLNGEILPVHKAFVPIEDRGYQFGDAVYEFIASYNGKLFCKKEHLERLERSMDLLSYPTLDNDFIDEAVTDLYERASIDRAGLYIQVSRGVAPRDHAWDRDLMPQVIMTIKKIKQFSPDLRKTGVDIITVEDNRWSGCDIKTVQLLPNAMAKQKAKEKGVFDALFVSKNGIVREGTSSNFFIVKNGTLFTHPLTRNILPGVTRKVVIALARELGIKIKEKFLSKTDLFSADEAFLTGTVTEIMGIKTIDNKKIDQGKTGEITTKLYNAMGLKTDEADTFVL